MNQSNEPVVEVCSKEGALSPSLTYSNGPGSLPCHSKLSSTHCIDRIKKTLIQTDSEKHNWKSFLKAFGKEGSETDRKSLNLKQDNQHGHHPYSKTLSKYPDRWVARKGHIRDGATVIWKPGQTRPWKTQEETRNLFLLLSSFLPLLPLPFFLSSFSFLPSPSLQNRFFSLDQVALNSSSCLSLLDAEVAGVPVHLAIKLSNSLYSDNAALYLKIQITQELSKN